MAPNARGRRGSTPRRTIRGCDGVVEIDEATQLVTKTYFHADPEAAVRNAQREISYASRFYDALAGHDGIACPKITAWDLSEPPRVVMELCPGENLSCLLQKIDGGDARIAEISGKIQAGIEVYTRIFGEPYYDLCFNNMLFDERTGTLTFLDFVIPVRPEDDGPDTPLEASLGWLIGCACYTLSRPAFLFSSTEAYLGLMRSVMTSFKGKVSSDRVYARALGAFSQMSDSGGRLRKHYYRTIGSYVTRGCLGRLRHIQA